MIHWQLHMKILGSSVPYNYEQYLSWGPGGYATEIFTGYDEIGEPIIVRPGSSIPLEGYDDVPGYNWDLMPNQGPFYSDWPLMHPGPDATDEELRGLGIGDVERGIPGALVYDYPTLRSEAYMPQDREAYTSVTGKGFSYLPAAMGGGGWEYDPQAPRYVRSGGSRDPKYRMVYGDYVYRDRHGNNVFDDLSNYIEKQTGQRREPTREEINRLNRHMKSTLGEDIYSTRPTPPSVDEVDWRLW
jgi:hypothetical protein